MALYKTICLELIRERPELYERLRTSKRLLPSMDAYAIELKTLHEEWKERLDRSRPNRDPSQVAGEALELAIKTFRNRLPSGSEETEDEPISLDEAIHFIRRATPTG